MPLDRELYAPTLWRSDVLSAMYEAVRRGELAEEVGRERLAYVNGLKIRLLGDAVLRRRAWSWRSSSTCPRPTRRSTSRSPSSRSALS